VSLKKISFSIKSASGTPAVAEFETYAGSTQPTPTPTPTPTPDPTVDPTATIVGSAEELLSAIQSAEAGSTIFVRGGTYYFGETITLDQSGNQSNIISLSKHPDDNDRPMLDFSAMSESSSNRGLKLHGDYWHIYGIDVRKAGDNCLYITGSNNEVEFSTFSECADSGVQLAKGASDNLIKNVDSYYNADSSLENADGFAAKLDLGDGNKFYGCRAWNNLDDGFDGYLRGADNITTTYENSWQDGHSATESDFVSVDIDELLAPRKADGSLPDVNYFKLANDSDLIDAGVDVGLPYNGSAPDIGAFESE
jgi:hypothetical protein